MNLPLGKEIGKRIRCQREKRGWTQDDLADVMHYEHRMSISRFETGKHLPRINTLYAIAKALGCSVYQLMPEE